MWEIFALGAALAWSVVNVLDKILLQGRLPSRNTYLILQGMMGLIPVGGMVAIGHLPAGGSPEMLALAVLAGVLESAFIFGYYVALQKNDASLVAILLQGVPVLTIGISLLVFQEVYAPVTYLGVVIIIAGTVLATVAGSPPENRAGRKMIGAVIPALLAISISYTLQSYTLRTLTVDTVFVAGRVGQLLVGLGMLAGPAIRPPFVAATGKLDGRIGLIIVAVGMLNLFGVYLQNAAYAQGPLALVTTVISVQPILVLFLVLAVNAIRPRAIPDEGSRAFLGPRAVATALVIAGIFLSSS